ncbi:MAG: diadenylate cyclase CdaA [Rhodothermales bacterium]
MTLFEWIIPIRLVDLAEIGLVAFLFYRLYLLMRGTIAVPIFVGLLSIYLLQFLVDWLEFTILQALFGSLSEIFVLTIIILFQPEIRRVLLMVGQNPFLRRLLTSPAQQELITEITAAVGQMSQKRIGALIVFARSTGLRNYIETGELIQAKVSRGLLVTIFYAQNPLHDGAVIVQNRRIEAARCILPVSTSMRLNPHLGLRHRAAVGLTEQTDAFVVVVSEETGHISVAESGDLASNLTPQELRTRLTDALSLPATPEADLSPAEV